MYSNSITVEFELLYNVTLFINGNVTRFFAQTFLIVVILIIYIVFVIV